MANLNPYLEITTTCDPDYDRPELQKISITACLEDGTEVCTLEALRWAQADFELTDAQYLHTAFDDHSAFAASLSADICRQRRALAKRHDARLVIASGFIGIITIKTPPDARGHRFGVRLIQHLQMLHAGMTWYVGLQAAPLETEHETAAYRQVRARLIAYYRSDTALGFEQVAPRSSPSLMTALWDQELSAFELPDID
jgi:hypothetical protein